jgi:hypothetical protein
MKFAIALLIANASLADAVQMNNMASNEALNKDVNIDMNGNNVVIQMSNDDNNAEGVID